MCSAGFGAGETGIRPLLAPNVSSHKESCSPALLFYGPFVMVKDPRNVALESIVSRPDTRPASMRSISGRSHLGSASARPVASSSDSRPLHFTWESDSAGCLLHLSTAFLEQAGQADLSWDGQHFTQVLATLGFGETQKLAHALDAGRGFYDLELETAAGGRLSLEGVSTASAGVAACGFGLFWTAPSPGNVVTLRGGSLNAQERSAFQEIARTLNEALELWQKPQDETHAPARRGDQNDATPPGRGALQNESSILDHLPIGLVVQRGVDVIQVNRTLLDWCGMDNAEAFEAAGGLDACLDRSNSPHQLACGSSAKTRIPVDVQVLPAPWLEQPALMHVVFRLEPSETRAMREAPVRGALDLIPAGILILDRDGRIETANAALIRLCGWCGEDLRHEPFTMIFSPASHADAAVLLREVTVGVLGQSRTAPLRLRTRDGLELDIDATLAPLDGKASQYCLVLRPITPVSDARARPEAEPPAPALPDLLAQDEQPWRAGVDALAPCLWQGLRGPLTTVMEFAEALQAGAYQPRGEARALQVDAALDAGRQVLATLRDMEDLFQAGAPGELETVDLARMVEGVAAGLRTLAVRRRALVRLDLAPQIALSGRAGMWPNIVRLILEDALCVTPMGGQVLVSARRDGNDILLLVRDHSPEAAEEEDARSPSPLAMACGAADVLSARRPFRLARIGTLAQAQKASVSLRPCRGGGMLVELRVPA